MVVSSESYVQNLQHKTIGEALTLNLAPRTYIGAMLIILMLNSNLRNILANFERF